MKPPTPKERDQARAAAAALRQALADPTTMGAEAVVHVDFCRPRRGAWFSTWENLPGFLRENAGSATRYSHTLLPGWEYSRAEVKAEMIPDLEALAELGVRPTEATSK